MAFSKSVYRGGQGEIVEKKSRFIATIRPVNSEEEAMLFINEMKKKYYDARHNCSAFIIGSNGDVKRFSDDGEPSGTAGRPMLDILEREGIYNTAVVVTRYFGGVLLGTGGLVRAYQAATQEGLRDCVIIEQLRACMVTLSIPYTLLGKIQYYCGKENIPVLNTDFKEQITMTVLFNEEDIQRHNKAIISLTEGIIEPESGEMVSYAIIDGKVEIF